MNYNTRYNSSEPFVPTQSQLTDFRSDLTDISQAIENRLTSNFTVNSIVTTSQQSGMPVGQIFVRGPSGSALTFDIEIIEDMFEDDTPISSEEVESVSAQLTAAILTQWNHPQSQEGRPAS